MALTIVLLCSGNGSDSSHYRPSRDDVRYRHRHDALVRCVASTLFGAAGSDDHKPCEVVFFYDGDFSCMHMRLARPSTSSTNAPMSPSSIKGRDPPFEKDIVAEWRRASKEAIRQREQHIHERRNECTPSMWMDRTLSSSFSSGTMGNISSVGRDSRRQNMQNQSGRSGEKIEEDLPRLETCCVLDSWKTVSSSSSNTISSNNEKNSFSSASSSDENSGNISKTIKKLPSNMPSSKRDILTTLQSICPVDYLRTHHLNVPLDVALRKCNKNKLMVAWEGYRGYLSEKTSATKEDGNIEISVSRKSNNAPKNAVHEDVKLDNKWDEIERTFRSLMTKAKGSASRKGENDEGSKITSEKECSTDVMAAYLHESCDAELPCWGWDFSTAIEKIGNNKENEVQHIFLFLGAVRDMTETENNALSHACNRLRIPLVPCRLGPVPEFTSKIISVAGYHYHRGLLGDGLVGLWKCRRSRERQTETTRSLKMNTVNQALSHKRSLHVIAILPIDSKSLTADPSHRTRVHWCMVRLCVCSLWRSKLASASEAEPSHTALKNVLTFVFNDGKKLTLEQMEFISTMAENHKAAPSERQVLEELCRRRNDIGNVPSEDISFLTNGEESSGMEAFALDFTDFSTSKHRDASSTRSFRQIIDMAYSEDVFANQSLLSKLHGGKSALLYAIIEIRSSDHAIDNQMAKEVEVHKSIKSSLALASIQIRGQRTIIEAQDGEACTVMMLQHLDYQGVLFPLLRLDDDQSNNYLASKDVILSANIQDLRKRRKKQKKDTSSKRQRSNKTIK